MPGLIMFNCNHIVTEKTGYQNVRTEPLHGPQKLRPAGVVPLRQLGRRQNKPLICEEKYGGNIVV